MVVARRKRATMRKRAAKTKRMLVSAARRHEAKMPIT